VTNAAANAVFLDAASLIVVSLYFPRRLLRSSLLLSPLHRSVLTLPLLLLLTVAVTSPSPVTITVDARVIDDRCSVAGAHIDTIFQTKHNLSNDVSVELVKLQTFI